VQSAQLWQLIGGIAVCCLQGRVSGHRRTALRSSVICG